MSAPKTDKETPLMKQYNGIKAKYPDAILLFRVGDFYETFGADAVKTSQIVGIVLTRRANGVGTYIELAGFPHHSLDSYLPKLVRAGYRVAICDQLEDPKMTKTIVKRGVTELVTPGLSYNDKVLDHNTNNFLASVFFNGDFGGVSFLDISTGEFFVGEGNISYIDKLIQSFKPSEIIYRKDQRKELFENVGEKFHAFGLDDWAFTHDFGFESLTKHFQTNSLKGFGIEELHHAIASAGAILHYLSETRHDRVQHISNISRVEEEKYVWLDRFTVRNLELFASNNEKGKSLIDVIDVTVSPMGKRLLKRWLALPLKDIAAINERLDVVAHFLKHEELREELRNRFSQIGDLERLISKVAAGRANPRELVQLKRSLNLVAEIKTLISDSENPSLKKIAEQLNSCDFIREKIDKEIREDAPVLLNKGNVIAEGVHEELDHLRAIAFNGKDYLLQVQKRESERTSIPSLKVAFNNVFGYYLEVTHAHKDKVPQDWIRKQTLVNAERYITPELKEYEEKILGAEEKILAIETTLFANLLRELSDYIVPVQLNASLVARLDCLLSFSVLSFQNNFCRPEINEGFEINIKDGRHPVIEKQLPLGVDYIANDVFLDNDTQQIMMITGPNMSGKSALLRQTAIIVLMGQIGSYVPASSAKLGLIDKVFTRVGASDNISSGESTFMVEMNETASILNNLSDRSLVLLDEIGRGTSTYDGISIAWAIAEFIHDHPKSKAKTLFATHYHELNEMTNYFARVKNFNVSVKEINNKIIFMRKLEQGGSEHSFGIHVARMAGMPKQVVDRANIILKKLEKEHEEELAEGNTSSTKNALTKKETDYQLSFFNLNDPVLENIKDELLKTDINTLTPVEALMKLNEIRKMVTGK
ncbi:MAG: DNA mismatch repair protein MutS [Bacteroidia bacterium]|nr:DNA mismatch repair protein MutS [Bacteroidia bacterium]